MPVLQISFIVLTFAAPLLLWRISARRTSKPFDVAVCRTIAAILLATQATEFCVKVFVERTSLTATLPMHLCDWTLLAAMAALWFRWQACFEVTYFWGLAGTIQALFTPAIA